MLKDTEKFWAFGALLLAIVGLVFLASTFDRGASGNDIVMQGKLRIIDSAITGLLTIAGMCARSLFELVNKTSERIGEVVASQLESGQAAAAVSATEAKASATLAPDDLPEVFIKGAAK